MPRGGFGGGGFGRGGLGGPPVFRGGGLRLGCFGGLFGPLLAGLFGFLLGRNVSANPQTAGTAREDELRRREEDVRRREEAVRRAEEERGNRS